MKAKPFVESAGLAVLYALPIANAFLKSWHVDSFHHAHPVASIPRAILLLTLLVWALAWLIIAALDRLSPRGRKIAGIALPTLLIWLLGRVGAGIFGAHPAVVRHVLLAAHIALAVVPLVLLVLWRLRPGALGQALEATRAVFTIAAFGMLILLPKLAWQALRFEAPEQISFTNPPLPAASSTLPRIVWILMDELSYDQVFEHPPSGLTFPHFEHFAQRSTTFSNLQPTGYHTEEVIPGLIPAPAARTHHPCHGQTQRSRAACARLSAGHGAIGNSAARSAYPLRHAPSPRAAHARHLRPSATRAGCRRQLHRQSRAGG